MHRLAATPGGWNPNTEGVVFIEQSQAPLVVLTAADTDIQLLSTALSHLPQDFPAVRVTNVLNLQQQLTIDTYAEDVLTSARVIVLRLLGGRAYWSYGLEVVKQTVEQTGAALFVLPGDEHPDPDLLSHSTVSLAAVNQLWRYLTESGLENTVHALQFMADVGLGTAYHPILPAVVPRVGLYSWSESSQPPSPPTLGGFPASKFPILGDLGGDLAGEMQRPKAGILFYRAHYLAANTEPIDALCRALVNRRVEPVPVFVSSLRDAEVQADVLSYFQPKDGFHPKDGGGIDVLLNTTSFSLARLDSDTPQLDLWERLNVPVLQVILSSSTGEQWAEHTRGLAPRDVAMNVALPEVDGRIISRAVSFKAIANRDATLETDVVRYESVSDRVEFVAQLAANWAKLRHIPIAERRVALILANYPTRDGRLANGVGLDTPASCVGILEAMQQAGYTVDRRPQTGDELIRWLTSSTTNDPESEGRSPNQSLGLEAYQAYFETLPTEVQLGMGDRWDKATADFPISGIQLGNVFVGIQPARGYDLDPTLNYHAPDLEPTHAYLAFYHWLRSQFGAAAIVHVGKHGNLEWLPGKSIALSKTCYPEVALGALPHLYPFIVNDPGEGAQAKRRAQAVIIDHLTPPMTRAELYGPLQQLEGLVDEYYEAQSLDPSRLSMIRDRILNLMQQSNLDRDLATQNSSDETDTLKNSASPPNPPKLGDFDASFPQNWGARGAKPTVDKASNFELSILNSIDGYLCELKEAQIRDGLHIFGQCPQGRQLRDLIVAIARHPGQNRPGLTRAIAQAWGLDLDPLTVNPTEPVKATVGDRFCHTAADVIEVLETEAARLVESLLSPTPSLPHSPTLIWIGDRLLPALRQTSQEITNLLRGLNGEYVPSGASGAPTRGRPEVLPTGRNFYSVDIRAIPTESAWNVGRKAAEALIERYTQEQGDYPKTLALSIWGTSTMRTGGDDLAEALALLGVQPVWDGVARRVVDFEIVPLSRLGRPRVDVMLRISGFFRDAFPNLIDLFHQAVQAVAALDEPDEQNPLAAQATQAAQVWAAEGLTPPQPEEQLPIRENCLAPLYRVFGSKPGAYGAGLQGLIESQNWTDDQDLARAYINWSSYAYTGQGDGKAEPEAFKQRLQQLQIVLHNQDNREHDLLDSDDYYQFQGGLTAAVRAVTGRNPQTYFGDHALPENPKVRSLREEIAKVYRSRVVNPKWIAGVMRHGYKGAFEMSATVDYLFAYDATTHCVEDHMYQGVAQAYIFDPEVQAFTQAKNPWALRDMAERLLEAHQRGLWKQVDAATLDQLRAIALQAEGAIEERG